MVSVWSEVSVGVTPLIGYSGGEYLEGLSLEAMHEFDGQIPDNVHSKGTSMLPLSPLLLIARITLVKTLLMVMGAFANITLFFYAS